MKKKRKKGKPKQSQQSSGRSVAAQPLIEALFVHAGEQFKSSGGFKTTVPTMEKKKIMDESIFEIKNVLSEKEAGSIIEAAEKQGFVNSFQRETRECAHRDNGRIQFYSNIIAESMWDRISPFLPENIWWYRYVKLNFDFRELYLQHPIAGTKHKSRQLQAIASKSTETTIINNNKL